MMNSSSDNFEIGLNIHLLSFTLPKNLIKDREEVRVSITTMPEGKKQHFYLKGKKMNCSNHVFSINITNQTKNIIIVFRKKNFFTDNPIIASKTLHMREYECLPKQPIETGMISTEVKTYNVYYPLQVQKQEEKQNNLNDQANGKSFKRKVLGQMQIQLTFTPPYSGENEKRKEEKSITMSHKMNKKHRKNDYQKINNENVCDTNLI